MMSSLIPPSEGIRPPHAKTFVPYDEAIKDLDTGDLVLFAGATSQGAIIRFFDHSQFSHVGLVSPLEAYTCCTLAFVA